MGRRLTKKDFAGDVVDVARALIGCTLLVDGVGGVIVEVEAYDQSEPGSHCHPGVTPRNQAMFGPPGHAYVYFNYGLHWCLNFVCGKPGHGCGVLIRALRPTRGLEVMRARRGTDDERRLCAGPGCIGQALAIHKGLYGLPLYFKPFSVHAPDHPEAVEVVSGPRIGISKAQELPWRFGLAGSRYLSRPFKLPAAAPRAKKRA